MNTGLFSPKALILGAVGDVYSPSRRRLLIAYKAYFYALFYAFPTLKRFLLTKARTAYIVAPQVQARASPPSGNQPSLFLQSNGLKEYLASN